MWSTNLLPQRSRRISRAALFAILAYVATRRSDAAKLVVAQAPGSLYQTIQSAINAAVPGQDDVSVECGLYQEIVAMRDGVSVRGVSPGCTTIQGLAGATGPTVTIPNLATSTELSGFTIRGNFTQPGIFGGGGSAVISRNVIEQNTDAIRIGGTGIPRTVISRNVVRNNATGGIHIDLFDASSLVTITRNLIVGSGAGVFVGAYPGSMTIANNTIVGNSLGGVEAYALYSPSTVVIANNVLVANDGNGNGAFSPSVPPQVENNDVWSNDFYVYPGSLSPSNFSLDPRFVDQNAEFAGFEPNIDSPLIDRASAAWAPPTDLRGVPWTARYGYGPSPDIGARENEGVTGMRVPFRNEVHWDGYQYQEYQVLRGSLNQLRASGAYRQPGAPRFCELDGSLGLVDQDVPVAGDAFFYIATGWSRDSDCESPLGFTSGAVLRPGAACWSSCPVGSGGP